MIPEVWNRTLSCLKEDPSYKNMFHMMENYGNKVGAEVIDKEGQIVTRTYDEYIHMSKAACGYIQKLGFNEKNGFIGLRYRTCMDWPVLLWGILMSGNIPVLLNPDEDSIVVAGTLLECGAKAYVSDTPINDCNIKWINASDVLTECEEGTENWGDYVALCTSGTTGTSRIFLYDGPTVAAQILSFDDAKKVNVEMPFDETKVTKVLAVLPFHHVFGFSVVYLLYACTGKILVYLRNSAPKTILTACRRHGVTHLYCVPMFFNAIADGISARIDASKPVKWPMNVAIQKKLLGTKIRSMITGGGYIPKETLNIINNVGYPLCNGFGMTESGIICCETSTSANVRKKGSLGMPFSVTEYMTEPEGAEEGELLIRGDALYTASVINGEIVPRDKSAWFHTGDIVTINKDGIFIKGRMKDVIINASGENVYPDEIEKFFSDASGVKRLCVLGVKDGLYEKVTLIAELEEDADKAGFYKYVTETNKKLQASEKIQKVLVSQKPIPVSGNMKVKRQLIKRELEADRWPSEELIGNIGTVETSKKNDSSVKMKADFSDTLEYREVREKILGIVSDNVKIDVKDISCTAGLIDEMGIDSLTVLNIVVDLEKQFDLIILNEDIRNFTCVNDMADYIYAKKNGIALQGTVEKKQTEYKRITKFEESEEYKSIKQRMAETFKDGNNPYFVPHDSLIRDTSVIGGKEMINLGSYNYLGMSGNPETEEAAIEAIKKYGTSASGSRTLAGEKTLYQQLEKAIAEWKHTEDAIVCTGGWATNLSFVSCFAKAGDLIVYDELSHNSLTDGIKLSEADSKSFRHNDLERLEEILRKVQGKYNKVLIIVEGVYSMDGDIAPIPEFVRLKKQYGCFLMVDEAHSGGVIGDNAGGCDDYFHLEPHDIDIKYGTLSKALGTCGGYVASDHSLVEYLRYSMDGFVFSAGIAPPLAAACMKAIEIIRRDNTEATRLHRNISYFVKRAKEEGMNTFGAGESGIVPILIGDDADAARISAELMERGVFIPPAMYPAVPMGESRMRVTISSTHSIEQLEKAITELSDIMHKEGFLK